MPRSMGGVAQIVNNSGVHASESACRASVHARAELFEHGHEPLPRYGATSRVVVPAQILQCPDEEVSVVGSQHHAVNVLDHSGSSMMHRQQMPSLSRCRLGRSQRTHRSLILPHSRAISATRW